MTATTLCPNCLELTGPDGTCVDSDCYRGHHRVLLCTGDRSTSHEQAISRAFDDFKPSLVIVGDAKGVDAQVVMECERQGIEYEVFKAEWDKYHRAAGPYRNQAMVDRVKELYMQNYEIQCAAFHNDLWRSKGTLSCVEIALKGPFNRVFVYGDGLALIDVWTDATVKQARALTARNPARRKKARQVKSKQQKLTRGY